MERYKPYFKNPQFLISLGMGLILLAAGVVISYFAIIYATERASGPVTDIILSNLRVFDVDQIFIYGPTFFWIIVAVYGIFMRPEKLPFSCKSIALFLVIRSLFITLTHIGPFPGHDPIPVTGGILNVFTSGNDLFFSGHTGLPFLMALLLWDNKLMRWFCLASSVFFGAIVLMAHLHYSIDVFAAFFITYSIFHIATWLFAEDEVLARKGLPAAATQL